MQMLSATSGTTVADLNELLATPRQTGPPRPRPDHCGGREQAGKMIGFALSEGAIWGKLTLCLRSI